MQEALNNPRTAERSDNSEKLRQGPSLPDPGEGFVPKTKGKASLGSVKLDGP